MSVRHQCSRWRLSIIALLVIAPVFAGATRHVGVRPTPLRRPFVRLSDFRGINSLRNQKTALKGLRPNWREEYAGYLKTDTRTFSSASRPEQVWRALTKVDPARVWHSSFIQFQYAVDAAGEKIRPSFWPGLEPGQKLFIDLKGVPPTGIVKVGLGLQITRVDPKKREIRFEYIDPSPSVGEQRIKLEADGHGGTKI